MRYTTDHKEQTRLRIIEIASSLFKEEGINATGVAAVMKQANLTNGAFYAHFDSKDALVDAVIKNELEHQLELFQKTSNDISGLKQIITKYLSKEHRDNCGAGCPSAALLSEITKRSETTKKRYSEGLSEIVDSLASIQDKNNVAKSRQLTLALVGMLIGTLQLSRAVTDPLLSNELLDSGKKAAFALLESYESTF